MPLLPYLGETVDTEDWSDSQVQTFVACSYLIITTYLAVLVLALTNFF